MKGSVSIFQKGGVRQKKNLRACWKGRMEGKRTPSPKRRRGEKKVRQKIPNVHELSDRGIQEGRRESLRARGREKGGRFYFPVRHQWTRRKMAKREPQVGIREGGAKPLKMARTEQKKKGEKIPTRIINQRA